MTFVAGGAPGEQGRAGFHRRGSFSAAGVPTDAPTSGPINGADLGPGPASTNRDPADLCTGRHPAASPSSFRWKNADAVLRRRRPEGRPWPPARSANPRPAIARIAPARITGEGKNRKPDGCGRDGRTGTGGGRHGASGPGRKARCRRDDGARVFRRRHHRRGAGGCLARHILHAIAIGGDAARAGDGAIPAAVDHGDDGPSREARSFAPPSAGATE